MSGHGRNSLNPVEYSPATRRAMLEISSQFKHGVDTLPPASSRRRMTELARLVALSLALQLIASAHRRWDDSGEFVAVRANYSRELSDFEMGIPAGSRP